jgi:hypothetical protein
LDPARLRKIPVFSDLDDELDSIVASTSPTSGRGVVAERRRHA